MQLEVEIDETIPVAIPDVRELRDMDRPVWDAIVTAGTLYELYQTKRLRIDPDKQRGRDSVTGADIVKKAKVEQWAEDLIEGKLVAGQLTWNLREEDCQVRVENGDLSFTGTATIPDSGHRHRAIFEAMEAVERGASFNADQPFSLRIWHVSKDLEGEIFYKMNQESHKADATRSKWLAQTNPAQQLAREVVRMSAHLTDRNVETVRDTVSKKNPRLCAFNTISSGFEYAWEDVGEGEVDETCAWFLTYWDALVEVLPQLKRLSLPDRQRARETLVGAAITIQAYVRIGRKFFDSGSNFDVLRRLNEEHLEPDESAWDLFDMDNPLWQRIGVVVPSVNMSGVTSLRIRNSHQSRRAMESALLSHLGLGPSQQTSS